VGRTLTIDAPGTSSPAWRLLPVVGLACPLAARRAAVSDPAELLRE
jgi:hypothetical protein